MRLPFIDSEHSRLCFAVTTINLSKQRSRETPHTCDGTPRGFPRSVIGCFVQLSAAPLLSRSASPPAGVNRGGRTHSIICRLPYPIEISLQHSQLFSLLLCCLLRLLPLLVRIVTPSLRMQNLCLDLHKVGFLVEQQSSALISLV